MQRFFVELVTVEADPISTRERVLIILKYPRIVGKKKNNAETKRNVIALRN